ncbi:hypothetical protein [Enterococcus sp. 5H]|uniref:hypothetical protein n=1 Tax=Enterococcus sp. 5H TaxID=1229490 RepID=UPI0023038DDA|nr:hypothetical protein [Enterococcus sp. 5H]MDA9471199.1 hypothetical protein [Enterococcus sp. 5H]
MMSKKTNIGIALLMCLFIFAGCGSSDRYAKFSKEDQQLSWQGEHKRSFGDSDYSKIETEAEAFSLVKDKYQLAIPSYYEESKKLIEDEIPSEKVKQGETLYSVFTREKELSFQTTYTFYEEDELQIMADVTLNYEFSKKQEQAYLRSQIVSIKVVQVKGQLPNDNVGELIQNMGQTMKFSDETIATGLAGYELQVDEATSPITTEFLPVVQNTNNIDKDTEFTKIIAVSYDVDGTLREIYGEISDLR